jgi:hypothetical protein
MDVEELIRRAWSAVENAGVPEGAQAAALQGAIAFLRAEDGSAEEAAPARRDRSSSSKRRSTSRPPAEPTGQDLPDENAFFQVLASESGVEEADLRDVLLFKDGKVTVSPPTRMFGGSRAAQAKAITALVAGARAKGLGESTVRSEFVHNELKRKQCWDMNNFNKHLGSLSGYNVGSDRSEIVTTSKWVGEFSDAVAQALGKSEDE